MRWLGKIWLLKLFKLNDIFILNEYKLAILLNIVVSSFNILAFIDPICDIFVLINILLFVIGNFASKFVSRVNKLVSSTFNDYIFDYYL